MNEQEREALRLAVQRDVDVIMAACAPSDWKDNDFREEKMALGCIHPLDSIIIGRWEGLRPIAYCEQCKHELDPEIVKVRLNQ